MKKKEQISTVAPRLRNSYAREERLWDTLLHWIEDPLRPKTNMGNLRINPVLVLLAAMALLTLATFLFFSIVQL